MSNFKFEVPDNSLNFFIAYEPLTKSSEAFKEYEEAVGAIAQLAMKSSGIEKFKDGAPMGLYAKFYLREPRDAKYDFPINRDLDGTVKTLCDGLNGIVWHDDKFIKLLIATKEFAKGDKVGTKVFIWELDDIERI